MSDSAALIAEAQRHLPELRGSEIELTPIEKGGSDRRFYRLRAEGATTLILVKYNSQRAENSHYAEIAQFLADNGIRAPRIYFHAADSGLIGLEDLGERDLWSYRAENWPARRALYQSAIAEVTKLHAADAGKISEKLQPAFTVALYQWEQDYFFEHCLGGVFGMAEAKRAELRALPILHETSQKLAGRPRVLIHRDFQSQNIMVREGQTYLIDFQGMRFGLPEYDLASLLFDPYVELSEADRAELLGGSDREIFRLCAMQRLMQALGAYGFLGLVKGNRSFLKHIPAALASLRSNIEAVPGTERLAEALAEVEGTPIA